MNAIRHIPGVGLTVALLLITAPLPGQTLADRARQERERLSETTSRTYTNADLQPAPAAPAGPALPLPAAETAAIQPVKLTDKQGRDAEFWSNAFQAARDDIRRAEDNVRIAELKVNELDRRLLLETSMYNREYRLAGEIAAAMAARDQARKDLEDARGKVADLEEELRRSGGPAGWAR